MPRKKEPTSEDMLHAEKEIGENIPAEMLGLDTEDVGDAPAKTDDEAATDSRRSHVPDP